MATITWNSVGKSGQPKRKLVLSQFAMIIQEGLVRARAKKAPESVKREVAQRAQRSGRPAPAEDKRGGGQTGRRPSRLSERPEKVVGLHRWASYSGKNLPRY